ncbi:MAG: hypothetical protein HYY06_04345 [Deltaproteobacteria bacterium]|nr:hypothetical protein [Deltaproteobacteria bacterium]
MKNLGRGVALALLVAVVIVPSALASDGKIYPGAICRAENQSHQQDLFYFRGGVENDGSSSRWVDCPLVTDDTNNTSGLQELKAFVYIPGTTTVTCYAYSYDSGGEIYDSASHSRNSTGALDFDSEIDSVDNGFYRLRCWLPVDTRLATIRASET